VWTVKGDSIMAKLQAYDEKTRRPVNIGDTVTDFRGDTAKLWRLERARARGRSGKVGVEFTDGSHRWHYDGVWGLIVLEASPCDECDSNVPPAPIVNPYHAEGCSLNPSNVVS
jgi:hypothetical protein